MTGPCIAALVPPAVPWWPPSRFDRRSLAVSVRLHFLPQRLELPVIVGAPDPHHPSCVLAPPENRATGGAASNLDRRRNQGAMRPVSRPAQDVGVTVRKPVSAHRGH